MDTDDKVLQDWIKSRPEFVQEKIRQYPPHSRYRLKSTNQIVSLYSYEENDGKCDTCKVIALGKDSNGKHSEDRLVFGIPFSDLEELN